MAPLPPNTTVPPLASVTSEDRHVKVLGPRTRPRDHCGPCVAHLARGRLLAQLPQDQREVFVMRELQDLSFKEIADITGISENTAKSRMRYALEKLRGGLAEFLVDA